MTINPGVPHAYISGDVIEIMRNSDNVIRLGLTNKVKDVHSMVDVLTKGGPELIQKQVNHVGD